ncbi:MAG: amidohydrolase [Proteobacteria bacterium]|nr:amidohydrolase [Pseudomonadota bacterium]
MGGITRRKFLGSSAAIPLGLGIAAGSSAQGKPATGMASMIVTGANVYTMVWDKPKATAIAVLGKRLLAVGNDEDIIRLANASTRRIDARGMTVTPGFIDSHSHPILAWESQGVNVNLRRIPEVQDVLAQKAAATPPGEWVRGFMYDDTKFEEERPLNLRDLDDAVPNHPVYVAHRGGHTIVVNSKAFEVAGIDMDTPDPVGGKFYREDGEFTGKVAEYATRPFRLLAIPQVDRAQLMQSAILSSKAMAAAGLTSTTDAGCNRERFIAYNDARDAGELAFRISVMPRGGEFYDGLKKAGVSSGFGDDMIRIGAAKFGADGSASERTMYMSTPYEGTDDHGILTMTQEQIDDAVDDAVAHGFRVGIHANGDWTIDMVLKAYERVLKNHQGPNPRHRIEHCSLINDSLLARIKAAGVVPTPFYTYAHYHGNKWVDYGEEKMESMFAHRSFLDAGIPVAPASDYGPGPYEPMMAIQSMVTRKDMRGRVWGPSQRISVTEAMRICTMHGAYASFEENIKGSLEAGKLADFVILEQDPHEVDPDTIKEIRIIQTVMGGLTTYEA